MYVCKYLHRLISVKNLGFFLGSDTKMPLSKEHNDYKKNSLKSCKSSMKVCREFQYFHQHIYVSELISRNTNETETYTDTDTVMMKHIKPFR